MEVKESTYQSGCLATFILFIAIFLIFAIVEAITVGGGMGRIEVILLIIYYLILIVSCFFIVKNNPQSIWYVPLICNALAIILVFSKDFWKDSIWIFLGIGLVISIIASVFGAWMGRKKVISSKS
jgi:membrane-associated HD superfamily phosphohydrolase